LKQDLDSQQRPELVVKHEVAEMLHHAIERQMQRAVIALIVALVVVSAWGTAYELQYNILNRPQQLTGTCVPPAVIANGGCFIHQTSVDAQGNSHTVLVPAGVLNK
jgi:hypothetical protein